MSDTVVELVDVRFAWRIDAAPQVAIDRLQIQRGERVLVRGPSGSGKSTLLNLLAGVIVPQQGRVRILDRDLATLAGAARDRFRAEHVGYVFQMFNLIAYLSPLENVRLPCAFSERRRERAVTAGGSVEGEALRLLGALRLSDEAALRRPAATLSVGQQQRVAVARALIGAPELVIADEPTSALDAERRGEFLDLLFSRCDEQGTTVIFASHDASLAPRFDRTLTLTGDGRCIGSIVRAAA